MQIPNPETTPYARGADFCRIFKNDMDRLYLLSFLLTGEDSLAEKCFIQALEASQKSNHVFKEWARSWSRRSIIQSAICTVRPQVAYNLWSSPTSEKCGRHAMTQPAEIADVIGLPQFERFVFVMSMLERYSYQECSLLLNCTRADVIAARTWALQQIAKATTLPCKVPKHRFG